MKTVVFCTDKMNYDNVLDFSSLSEEVVTYGDAEDLLRRSEGAEIIVTKENPVTGDMIASLPDSVKLIVEAGTGYNNIDVVAARKRNITVCNIPSYSSERVAETAFMFILNLSSSMQEQIGMLKEGNKDNFTKHLSVPHHEISQKTLGVIGEGHIGSRVIEIARAFRMQALVYTRTPKEDREGVKHVSLEELLKNSDYVTLHCPLTPATRHLIDAEKLSLMKEEAFLINTARGALIDQEALVKALKEKKIAGAGLDVLETEPPAEDDPLFELDNVILTPHMGWKGLETRQRLLSIIREDIDAYRKGEPVNRVS